MSSSLGFWIRGGLDQPSIARRGVEAFGVRGFGGIVLVVPHVGLSMAHTVWEMVRVEDGLSIWSETDVTTHICERRAEVQHRCVWAGR